MNATLYVWCEEAKSTDRAWQVGSSNATIATVLSERIDIIRGLKRCEVLYDDDINIIITNITIHLYILKELNDFNVRQ